MQGVKKAPCILIIKKRNYNQKKQKQNESNNR